MKKKIRAIAALIAAFGIGSAFAQHVWLDEKGVKQYSDLPPPATVPPNRVLKSPNLPTPRIAAASDATNDGKVLAAEDKAKKTPLTTAERNADFLKRKAEQDEKNKKAAEQAKADEAKSTNCDRAREYQRVLDSGQRIATADTSGERTVMSDERREKETRETRRILAECK